MIYKKRKILCLERRYYMIKYSIRGEKPLK